jgi:hypothetical protein
VRCIDSKLRLGLTGSIVAALLAGCGSTPPPAPAPVAARPTTTDQAAAAPGGRLQAPGAVRSWNEVRAQAAQRMVAANPGGTYTGAVPDLLLAIPVLEIELNADGSIRRIDVLRQPSQASETVQIAIDAVRRAAPFGDVSRLPKPWKFAETFLFNDDRKFKPRTLDL